MHLKNNNYKCVFPSAEITSWIKWLSFLIQILQHQSLKRASVVQCLKDKSVQGVNARQPSQESSESNHNRSSDPGQFLKNELKSALQCCGTSFCLFVFGVCVCVCGCVRMRVCVHACACMCVYACMPAYVCVCVTVCMLVCNCQTFFSSALFYSP